MSNFKELPSGFQCGQIVSVVFPGNATLRNCKITKVAFTEHSEPLYDVDVPFSQHDYDNDPDQPGEQYPPKTRFARLHALRQWFISCSQDDWNKMNAAAGSVMPLSQ